MQGVDRKWLTYSDVKLLFTNVKQFKLSTANNELFLNKHHICMLLPNRISSESKHLDKLCSCLNPNPLLSIDDLVLGLKST